MRITELSSRERAVLARRVNLDPDVDDATLAAFIGANLTADAGERIRLKQRAIERVSRRANRSGAPIAAQQQLDPSGAYPAEWLRTPPPQQRGRVTHGGNGRVTFAP